jgi:hypothetical protein
MPLLFFYALSFRKGLARDRVDGVIDADQLGGFDLVWSFTLGHVGADLFVDCLVLFQDIALDAVAGGLRGGELRKTGNVLTIRRLGRPLAI